MVALRSFSCLRVFYKVPKMVLTLKWQRGHNMAVKNMRSLDVSQRDPDLLAHKADSEYFVLPQFLGMKDFPICTATIQGMEAALTN